MLKLMCLYPSQNLRAIGSRKKLALDMKRMVCDSCEEKCQMERRFKSHRETGRRPKVSGVRLPWRVFARR